MRAGFRMEDVDGALAALDETFDIDRADIDRLLREVEQRALERMHGDLDCAAIMSRDVVTVGPEARVATARALMLDHNIRTLPVVDGGGLLLGTVGLRELASVEGAVGDHMTRPALAAPQDPAVALLPLLTDGQRHAVVIAGSGGRIEGIVTQTDLLAALARTLPLRSPATA
jgi:CBS domain-containing membrane protein